MRSLILYNTVGCHLCEQALELVSPLIKDTDRINIIDISESDSLIERYGIRIPVIVRDDNQDEISWPFNEAQFLAFLE